MLIQLNFKSGKPVYLQVVDQVKAAAASGALRTGEPLPSIRPLAEQLRVNRNTVAKAYDPRDPTPWFYDAIRKQTDNRPVEALQDLEKSIELNDNRAVYRSRLLLDQDLAAREDRRHRRRGDRSCDSERRAGRRRYRQRDRL